ncbi:MAG: VWA domain-containing protein [Planctomycetaceae bacterium]
MEWQTPQFLYLILPLCLSWLGLALYSERRRQLARDAFIANVMQARILPATSRIRFWCKLILFELALATGLIALAGPRFGTQVEQIVPRGSDLYVLIDVSRSMLADDVVPSRLERAKADVSSLVNRLTGERIGLIAFAGKAVVKCPLTIDYDSFRRALMELDPNSAPRGGTAIGDAIRKAVEVFHAGTQRDQAVLLITDGDDQESFPLEAATVAAERKVTIFTVGLGDSDSGARVPGQSGTASFLEHEGQQVWSKLNGSLLSEIALRTNGLYIPAGTRSYDLGELYTQHLQGRTGSESETQQRIRKSERFQVFLGIAILSLLVDLCISRYSNNTARPTVPAPASSAARKHKSIRPARPRTSSTNSLIPSTIQQSAKTVSMLVGIGFGLMSVDIKAGESQEQVREGLQHYQAADYESAQKLFAAATEELDKSRSSQAAIAAFNEACALHRKGDKGKARERYLKAGLSPDKAIATASHFNLGTLSAENARSIAGENPATVSAEDRQKILDELRQAVASWRHALELDPQHQPSRRNLELAQTWIKFYSDRWNEIDRQKRRDESTLVQFLEFLMTTQNALKQSVQQLPGNAPPDVYAQLKRNQDELAEELPFLRDKIAKELQPHSTPPGATTPPQPLPPELKEGIALLQSWSDKVADEMQTASEKLFKAKLEDAVTHQQEAVNQLDQIWNAVIPFHPLLTKELSDQTAIAEQLAPHSTTPTTPGASQSAEATSQAGFVPISPAPNPASEPTAAEKAAEVTTKEDIETNSPQTQTTPLPSDITLDESALQRLFEQQSIALQKARLLAPKAQAELSRLEANPPEAAADKPASGSSPDATTGDQNAVVQIDPEKLKQGLLKAVELSPKAVEAMQMTIDHLSRKDPEAASAPAEEARRILEEIQKAQPEQPQQDQNKEDPKEQDQKEQQKDDQSQKDDQQQEQKKKENDSTKSSEQKKDSEKKQNQKNQDENKQDEKNEEQKKQSDQKKDDKQKQTPDKSGNKSGDPKDKTQSSGSNAARPQISQDRIEDALRKVRERQQEKRERDREMRAHVIGRTPVERDW